MAIKFDPSLFTAVIPIIRGIININKSSKLLNSIQSEISNPNLGRFKNTTSTTIKIMLLGYFKPLDNVNGRDRAFFFGLIIEISLGTA